MKTESVVISENTYGNVVKSNDLVEAKYDLSLIEQKFVLTAISMLETGKNIVKVKVKDFCRIIGSSEERYSEIRDVVIRITEKKLLITKYDNKNDIKSELNSRWILSSYYENGVLELTFDNRLAPYLFELKERFTMYNLINIVNLSSKHSIRLYELLKEYEFRKKIEFDYENLKEIVCCHDKFSRYYDFKKRVLLFAQKELKEKTDICFDFDEIRKGKTIVAISFTIMKNEKNIKEKQLKLLNSTKSSYYGETDPAKIFDKYNSKSKEELIKEIQDIFYLNYNFKMDDYELDMYSKKAIMKTIFNIIDGEITNVEKPIIYFKKVLEDNN